MKRRKSKRSKLILCDAPPWAGPPPVAKPLRLSCMVYVFGGDGRMPSHARYLTGKELEAYPTFSQEERDRVMLADVYIGSEN